MIEPYKQLGLLWLDYHNGVGFVNLQFAPILKPFLLQLKREFVKYELGNVIHLKHTYSIRIYELLKQHQKFVKRKFDIQTLRKMLGISENEYRQFSDFRKRILKAAQQELAGRTDISFVWEEEKKNQKCVAITFDLNGRDFEIQGGCNDIPTSIIDDSQRHKRVARLTGDFHAYIHKDLLAAFY